MARKTHAPLDNAHAPGSKKITAPTLIDVAKVAGVSPITVSRALHRPEVVSKAAREKVMAAVQQVGYVSNMLAGSLASNRSRLVAILLPTIANSIFADTVQALMDSLATAGYQTLLGLTGYSATQEERLIEALLGRRPDGIVLTGAARTPPPVAKGWRSRASLSSSPGISVMIFWTCRLGFPTRPWDKPSLVICSAKGMSAMPSWASATLAACGGAIASSQNCTDEA